MIKQIIKVLVIAAFLYCLIVLQSSVLPLSYLSFVLGFLFVLVYNLLELSKQWTGIIIALWAGILIDIYASTFFFGFYAIVLMGLAMLIKVIISRYVRIP